MLTDGLWHTPLKKTYCHLSGNLPVGPVPSVDTSPPYGRFLPGEASGTSAHPSDKLIAGQPSIVHHETSQRSSLFQFIHWFEFLASYKSAIYRERYIHEIPWFQKWGDADKKEQQRYYRDTRRSIVTSGILPMFFKIEWQHQNKKRNEHIYHWVN